MLNLNRQAGESKAHGVIHNQVSTPTRSSWLTILTGVG